MDRQDWQAFAINMALALAGVAMLIFAGWPWEVKAHDALPTSAMPLGWKYDLACCAGYDCAQLPEGSVKEGPVGYEITLQPGQHPMVKDKAFFSVVPYQSKQVRSSPDGLFHGCILVSQRMPCLYVPPRGF